MQALDNSLELPVVQGIRALVSNGT